MLYIPECFSSSLHLYLCKRFKPSTLPIEQKANTFLELPSICRCMWKESNDLWKRLKQKTEGWRLVFRSNRAQHKYFILICTAGLAGIINEKSVYIAAWQQQSWQMRHSHSNEHKYCKGSFCSVTTSFLGSLGWFGWIFDIWDIFFSYFQTFFS